MGGWGVGGAVWTVEYMCHRPSPCPSPLPIRPTPFADYQHDLIESRIEAARKGRSQPPVLLEIDRAAICYMPCVMDDRMNTYPPGRSPR